MRAVRLSLVTATAVAALTAVTGCTEKGNSGDDDRVIDVTATDSKCEVSKKEFPAGHVELAIENKGSKVTEVYVLFPDDRIVTERENIGPGTKHKVTAEVKAGDYTIACKPGMKGDGIRQTVKATGGTAAKRDPRLDSAVAAYRHLDVDYTSDSFTNDSYMTGPALGLMIEFGGENNEEP